MLNSKEVYVTESLNMNTNILTSFILLSFNIIFSNYIIYYFFF